MSTNSIANKTSGLPLFDTLSLRGREAFYQSGRSFHLQAGEQLVVRAMGGDDYLYIADGRVQLSNAGEAPRLVDACGSEVCPFRMPQEDALTLRAESDVTLFHLDQDNLDMVAFWDGLSQTLSDRELIRRLEKMQRATAFRRLPAENLQEALKRMSSVDVDAGTEVVTQGGPGDSFYLIDEGRAEVWAMGLYDDEPQKVSELGPGDSFGEEALITGGTRTATVRMVEDGCLLVLNKEDFDDLVHNPMAREVSAPVAQSLLSEGEYELLDVRYQEEFEESSIPGATLIPLPELRQRMGELSAERNYVVYCRSGKRSAVASLLLAQQKFEVLSLQGGIRDWPFDIAAGQ